jgi:ribonuclease P protein subunit RPR2
MRLCAARRVHIWAACSASKIIQTLCNRYQLCDMPNDKPPKTKGVPNKHLHARATFLYQAATYLTLQNGAVSETVVSETSPSQGCSGLALQLGSDLQNVTRKGQVRLSMDLKRNICKSCNTILVPGRTVTQRIENQSKGGKKPWADVLIVECSLCGSKKRFPVGAKRQPRKTERDVMMSESGDVDQSMTSAVQTTTDQSAASGE